jgi:hypothetical protein
MLIDWVIYGLLVGGLAFVLNKTVFSKQGASKPVLWSLTIVVFFVNLVGMSVMKLLRYEAISRETGLPLDGGGSGDLPGAIVMTVIFYYMLKRREATIPDSKDAS